MCNLYYRLYISETECLNSTYCLWPIRQVAATEAGGKGLAILFYAQMNSLSFLIIHQIFLLAHDWSTNYVLVTCKTAKHPFPAIFPNFQNCTCCRRIINANYNSHLAQKYARMLSENCSLLRTDNVWGQKSKHMFAPNRGYCLFVHVSSTPYFCSCVSGIKKLP